PQRLPTQPPHLDSIDPARILPMTRGALLGPGHVLLDPRILLPGGLILGGRTSLHLLQRLSDPPPTTRTIVQLFGQLPTQLIAVEELILSTIGALGLGKILLSKLPQRLLGSIHTPRGIPRNLRAIQSHHTKAHHAQLRGQLQSLRQQARKSLLVDLTKPRDHRMVGHVLSTNDAEGHIRLTKLLDLPR